MDFGSRVRQLTAHRGLGSPGAFGVSGRNNGFTIIELMVTIAIVGIFAAIAVPSFSSLIHKSSVTSVANEFYDLLQYSRAEAVTRGATVIVSAPGAVNTAWNGDATVTVATTILRRIGTGGFQPNVVITSASGIVTFSPTGTATLPSCFSFSYAADNKIVTQFVGISGTGRITPPSSVAPATGECN
ncbi:MAG: hypothetical protein JWR17_3729 [Pseudomonas sp.]|jgi:type IV fimbrial biogenesis protein FimU|uniref:GspH/FimT family pseudopilin n=1 Tax=Pseudomonas sp. TaxID=306 RepID=UPI00262E3B0F|nr:GspH/FimT family pseudopilin [Pseudomonas sp.]MDB6050983.1 hypothetical protein [Pseudomonas sp.]